MTETRLSQGPERIYRHAMFDSSRWQEIEFVAPLICPPLPAPYGAAGTSTTATS